MGIGSIRTTRNKIVLAGVVGGLGLAQLITGGVLGADVYDWGLSAFCVLTALSAISLCGYIVAKKGEAHTELAFGLYFALFLANLQSTFVLGSTTAPLAEKYAQDVLEIYEEIIDEMLTTSCLNCMNAEDIIETQVLDANTQNFAGEATFTVLSVLQLVVMGVGCAVYLNNVGLTELGLVPGACAGEPEQDAGFGPRDELGFDEL